ncbi:MAG: ParB/RepB/Spo0J family partition protein [Lachnospiraceae bacterium]|nr:ParB/RepB/Spo0J family partition protein [Lachnospiraceae bacterium]
MATQKKALGKGLGSMIPDKRPATAKIDKKEAIDDNSEKIVFLKTNDVEPDREQPRKFFDQDAILELADSIKQNGILQPLLVVKADGYYKIISGERRWRAAKEAKLKEVPTRVMNHLSDEEIARIQLIENIQREDLNPIEEAIAYKSLIDRFKMTQDKLAETVSKSRTAITNSMRLLNLNEKVQEMVVEEKLSTGHARALLAIKDQEKQYNAAQRVFDEHMSVRETEKMVKKLINEKDEVKPVKNEDDERLNIIYHDMEEKLKQTMGTKVSIHQKSKDAGKIEIEYYNMDELDRIMSLLQSIQTNI